MIRVIVAGGRCFKDYNLLKNKLDIILKNFKEVTIVSGCAKGADSLGEQYAKEKGYNIIRVHADWNKHGKSAGYVRNEEMASISDACVCFWDGKSKGTENMIKISKKFELKLRVINY